ncbi:hypothetical protein QBC46DRAFT_414748, partial [Diplogelasinospora grovesii]
HAGAALLKSVGQLVVDVQTPTGCGSTAISPRSIALPPIQNTPQQWPKTWQEHTSGPGGTYLMDVSSARYPFLCPPPTTMPLAMSSDMSALSLPIDRQEPTASYQLSHAHLPPPQPIESSISSPGGPFQVKSLPTISSNADSGQPIYAPLNQLWHSQLSMPRIQGRPAHGNQADQAVCGTEIASRASPGTASIPCQNLHLPVPSTYYSVTHSAGVHTPATAEVATLSGQGRLSAAHPPVVTGGSPPQLAALSPTNIQAVGLAQRQKINSALIKLNQHCPTCPSDSEAKEVVGTYSVSSVLRWLRLDETSNLQPINLRYLGKEQGKRRYESDFYMGLKIVLFLNVYGHANCLGICDGHHIAGNHTWLSILELKEWQMVSTFPASRCTKVVTVANGGLRVQWRCSNAFGSFLSVTRVGLSISRH